VTPNQHGGRRYLPYVFTEQGVAMLLAFDMGALDILGRLR